MTEGRGRPERWSFRGRNFKTSLSSGAVPMDSQLFRRSGAVGGRYLSMWTNNTGSMLFLVCLAACLLSATPLVSSEERSACVPDASDPGSLYNRTKVFGEGLQPAAQLNNSVCFMISPIVSRLLRIVCSAATSFVASVVCVLPHSLQWKDPWSLRSAPRLKQSSNGSGPCTLLRFLSQDNENRRMDHNCTIPSTSWVVLLSSDDNRVHMRGTVMHLPHEGFHMVSGRV